MSSRLRRSPRLATWAQLRRRLTENVAHPGGARKGNPAQSGFSGPRTGMALFMRKVIVASAARHRGAAPRSGQYLIGRARHLAEPPNQHCHAEMIGLQISHRLRLSNRDATCCEARWRLRSFRSSRRQTRERIGEMNELPGPDLWRRARHRDHHAQPAGADERAVAESRRGAAPRLRRSRCGSSRAGHHPDRQRGRLLRRI
jgi:hypothetical protein